MNRLTDHERAVLRHLASLGEECGFQGFSPIGLATDLSRKEVRRACRSLKRKGFAEFSNGLFNEDGGMAGSGYAATRAGLAITEAGG